MTSTTTTSILSRGWKVFGGSGTEFVAPRLGTSSSSCGFFIYRTRAMRTIRQKNRCGHRQRGKFSNKIMHQCVTLRTAATATANRSMTDTKPYEPLRWLKACHHLLVNGSISHARRDSSVHLLGRRRIVVVYWPRAMPPRRQ